MPDQLRDRFDAFRTASTAQTRPPGVPAIRRTLSRRHATRAGAFAVAAVVAIIVTFAWALPPTGVEPAQPPSPSPSSSTPAPSVSTPLSPSGPVSGSPSHAKTGTSTSGAAGSNSCGPFGNVPVADLLVSNGPDTFTLGANLLAACPDTTLHITRGQYFTNGPSAKTLHLRGSVTHTLNHGTRTTTMPAMDKLSGCFTELDVTVIGSVLPYKITNLVPDLASTGSENATRLYFGNRGFELIETSWAQPAC